MRAELPHSYLITAAFFALLGISSAIVAQQPSPGSRTILVAVTVVDERDVPVQRLTKQQFTVIEKGKPLDITYFDGNEQPVSFAFLFDVSGSMPAELKKLAAQAVYLISTRGNKSSESLVIGFNEQPKVLCDWGCAGENLIKALTEVVETKPSKGTALYDAADMALQKLSIAKNSTRAIVIVSDGMDNSSKSSFTNLRTKIRHSDASVYAVGVAVPSGSRNSVTEKTSDILKELSAVSGGKAYFSATLKDITGIFETIRLQLAHRYSLGFAIPNAPDDKWHSIKVKLEQTSDNVRLYYRQGYHNR